MVRQMKHFLFLYLFIFITPLTVKNQARLVTRDYTYQYYFTSQKTQMPFQILDNLRVNIAYLFKEKIKYFQILF